MRSIDRATMTIFVALAMSLPAPANAGAPPKHMVRAEHLVQTVAPAANEYGEPAQITWMTDNGLDHSTNRTKCASLVTQLLVMSYGKYFDGWLGCKSPIAATYHAAIEVEAGFTLIEAIDRIAVGDIIAIRYDDVGCTNVTCGSFTGCRSSGHVALVASRPVARTATAPIVPGTLQFSVEVIDSSSDIHGSTDTRSQSDILGSDDQGVGRGTMRLYVDSLDPSHPVVGYTWSTWSGSTFYPHSVRDLVVGRIRRKS